MRVNVLEGSSQFLTIAEVIYTEYTGAQVCWSPHKVMCIAMNPLLGTSLMDLAVEVGDEKRVDTTIQVYSVTCGRQLPWLSFYNVFIYSTFS